MIVERQGKALELRKYGLTYSQISEELGISIQTAQKYVKAAMQAIPKEAAEDLRTLQLERLNAMYLSLWPKVQSGDERAIQTALLVMERMARYTGEELASRVDVNVQGGVLVIEGKADDFVAGLKLMAEAGMHDTYKDTDKTPELTTTSEYFDVPSSEYEDVVDADIVEVEEGITETSCSYYVVPSSPQSGNDYCARCGISKDRH